MPCLLHRNTEGLPCGPVVLIQPLPQHILGESVNVLVCHVPKVGNEALAAALEGPGLDMAPSAAFASLKLRTEVKKVDMYIS